MFFGIFVPNGIGIDPYEARKGDLFAIGIGIGSGWSKHLSLVAEKIRHVAFGDARATAVEFALYGPKLAVAHFEHDIDAQIVRIEPDGFGEIRPEPTASDIIEGCDAEPAQDECFELAAGLFGVDRCRAYILNDIVK